MKELQTGNPRELQCLETIEPNDPYSDLDLEQALHRYFAEYRVKHGTIPSEWFNDKCLDELDESVLKNLMPGWNNAFSARKYIKIDNELSPDTMLRKTQNEYIHLLKETNRESLIKYEKAKKETARTRKKLLESDKEKANLKEELRKSELRFEEIEERLSDTSALLSQMNEKLSGCKNLDDLSDIIKTCKDKMKNWFLVME